MAILAEHVPWYEQIFALRGFFSQPILLFGFQEIGVDPACFESEAARGFSGWTRTAVERVGGRAHKVPEAYRVADLVQLLRNRGLASVEVLDYWDERADLKDDMNRPIAPERHERYGTVIDIGSLEHVFDFRQCLENCLRMVRVGGVYFLHTCVRGYFEHGFHTFNPDALVKAVTQNGFEVIYHRYSDAAGHELARPIEADDVLIWLVARKLATLDEFVCPQQAGWQQMYRGVADVSSTGRMWMRGVKRILFPLTPPILADAYRALRGRRRSLVAPGLQDR
jgi:hypothetical protein